MVRVQVLFGSVTVMVVLMLIMMIVLIVVIKHLKSFWLNTSVKMLVIETTIKIKVRRKIIEFLEILTEINTVKSPLNERRHEDG